MSNHPVLRRDSSRGYLGGVCAGFARVWDVDPLLIRAGLIVATVVSSGLGLLLYLALWLAVPSDHRTPARPRTLALSPGRMLGVLGILVLSLCLTIPQSRSAAVGAAILAGLIAVWFAANRANARHPSTPPTLDDAGATPDAAVVPEWHQPPNSNVRTQSLPARAPQRRRPGAGVRVAATVVASWVVLAVAQTLGFGINSVAYPAVALAIIALAVIGSSLPRRAAAPRPRGLIGTGLVASVVTIAGLMPGTPPAGASHFQRFEGPDCPASQISLDMGTTSVDLSDLVLVGDCDLEITGDMAAVKVALPRTGNVAARYLVGMGGLTTPERSTRGDRPPVDIDVTENYLDASSPHTLTLNIALEFGTVEVTR